LISPAQSHLTTISDLEILLKLGFKINMHIIEAVDFINAHFPNLNLVILSMETESSLAKLNGQSGLLTRSVDLDNVVFPKLTFEVTNEDATNPSTGLGIIRTFYSNKNELIVDHVFFVIPEAKRSQGVARCTFRLWVQQYINMGVDKIRVCTGLSDGGYVWAINFFTADHRHEMDVILNNSKEILTDKQWNAMKKIYDHYYNDFPVGNAFPIVEWALLPFMKPILRGAYWDGTMNFNNSEQISNFIVYIFK